MRHGRIDANHAEIVAALRRAGATVQSLADVGRGCPDLLIGYRGRNFLAEVKDGDKPPSRRQLTPDESKWHSQWAGQVATVSSVAEALALLTSPRTNPPPYNPMPMPTE